MVEWEFKKPLTVNMREKEHQISEKNEHFITDVASKSFNGKIVILSKKKKENDCVYQSFNTLSLGW